MRARQGLFYRFFLLTLLLLLSACSNEYAEDIKSRHSFVSGQLNSLASKLNRGELSNALLISSYADKLSEQQPKLAPVAQQLKKDSGTNGPAFQNLKQRLAAINLTPENKADYLPAAQELDALTAAVDPLVYNDSLLDVVNTLSDLSEGKLARVNIPVAESPAGTIPGSHLVGNPNYGRWVENSNGGSFWQWYGQFRLLNDVMGTSDSRYNSRYRQGIDYDNWYRSRHYSYYDDWGRDAYGSAKDRQQWKKSQQTLSNKGIKTPKPKNYSNVSTQKRASTYASMSKTADTKRRSSRAPVSLTGSTTTSKTTSSSTTKRSSSFFGSSSRGTSSGSRSGYGGK